MWPEHKDISTHTTGFFFGGGGGGVKISTFQSWRTFVLVQVAYHAVDGGSIVELWFADTHGAHETAELCSTQIGSDTCVSVASDSALVG